MANLDGRKPEIRAVVVPSVGPDMFKVETIQKNQIDSSEVLVASSATKAPCKALIFLLCPDRSHGRTYRPIGRQIAGSACLSIRELDLYGNLPPIAPANGQASRIKICLTRLCLTACYVVRTRCRRWLQLTACGPR